MTVQLYKAVVVLKAASGMPEDDAQNTFHFECADAASDTATDVSRVGARLIAFYNTVPATLAADPASYIGEQISRGGSACKVLVYSRPTDNPAGDWGSPDGSVSWTLDAAAAGTPYPAEVAFAISYHADLTDIPETQANPTPPPAVIRPAARRRGRIYIGPLQSSAGVEDSTTHEPLPGSTFRNIMAGAAQELAAKNGTNDLTWVVASTVDDATYEVVGGWVDYAFDTQRRRGQAPIARQPWA